MGALFCNMSISKEENLVSFLNCCETMRNFKHSFSLTELGKGCLNLCFVFWVNARCCFIENNKRRIFQNCASN